MHRISVLAVLPLENSEKISEQILTLIEQAVWGDYRGDVPVDCDGCDHSGEIGREAIA
jgi:hypothetical protein